MLNLFTRKQGVFSRNKGSRKNHNSLYMQDAKISVDDFSPVEEFRQEIGRHIKNKFTSPLLQGLPDHLRENVANEIRYEAIAKAEEMLGPTLAHLHAAQLTKTQFEARLIDKFFSDLFRRWEHYIECRYNALSEQLSNINLLIKGNIKDIEILDGDPHNNLRKPIKITSIEHNEDKVFVFKSVNPFPQRMVGEICELVTDSLKIEAIAEKDIRSIGNAYLRPFSEHIKNSEKIDLKRYFYSYGAICSVASLMEISDLHFENVIVTRNGPQLIDVELLLAHVNSTNRPWNYINSGLFQPATSPIAQYKTHKYLKPTLRLDKNRIFFDITKKQDAAQHLLHNADSSLANPIHYVKDLQKGAIDADAALKLCGQKISKIIKSHNNPEIRTLIRSTAYYRILQMQLWLPARDIQDNILNVRNKLQRTASISSSFNSEIIERIIDAEISDLINGDIPYFWIDGLTGALNHSTGLINNSYANNVLKNFDSKFRLWSNRESSRNMNTIIKKLIQKDKRFL